MKPLHILVEYQETAQVLALREELASTRAALSKLKGDYTTLSIKFGHECTVNNELVDFCRSHGLKIRPGLDISKW